jgi:hypothetical protein
MLTRAMRRRDNALEETNPETPKRRHLSLLEVAIVLMVLASFSLFAIPKIQTRRILAHEENARNVLREIHEAQRQFLRANDGETFGFLGELLGAEIRAGVRVKPKMLGASGLKAAGYAHVEDGYLFTVVLPGRGVAGVTHDDYANAAFDKLSHGYLAYAWPVMAGYSGRTVFVMDQTGELRQYRNDREPPYSGVESPPPFNFGSRPGDAFGGPPPSLKDRKLEPAGG